MRSEAVENQKLTVYKAAGRMSDKRQQILEALEDVPKTIAMIERTLENYDTDQILSDLTVELYIRILNAIEGMMQWLVDKAGCECRSAVLSYFRMFKC